MPRMKGSITVKSTTNKIRKTLAGGIRKAVTKVNEEQKALIETWGPPPSKPFNPPHRKTGALHKSNFWEVDEANLIGMVGNTQDHAVDTELGTRYPERPWAERVWDENRDEIANIIAGGF